MRGIHSLFCALLSLRWAQLYAAGCAPSARTDTARYMVKIARLTGKKGLLVDLDGGGARGNGGV